MATEEEATPVGFAELVLGKDLYQWQANALTPLEDAHKRIVRISVCTPNGAGKSERIVACAALWWLAVYPKGTVVITTADSKQLDNQVWPAITAHRGLFPAYTWRDREIDTPTGGRVRAFTTDEAGRAEGWHKLDNQTGPLLMIIDEAKSVKEPIFQAIDRCTFNALMLTSSPGPMFGTFYDTFYRVKGWHNIQAGLKDCPHISMERIDGLRDKWGENNPFFQSTAHGKFMEQEGDLPMVFKLPELNSLKDNPPEFVPGYRSAFIDFGSGEAETTVYEKNGNRVRKIDAFREASVQITAGRLVATLRAEGFAANTVSGESNGPGKDIMDAMQALGYVVERVNTGAKPSDPAFVSVASEQWHQASAMVRNRECILPLGDDTLFKQLMNRHSVFTASGKIGVEEKHDMAKRGLVSPDRADAVCGVLTNMPMAHQLRMANKAKNPAAWMDYLEQNQEQEDASSFASRHAP